MPKGSMPQQLRAAKERVRTLLQNMRRRDRHLASIPRKFGFDSSADLIAAIREAEKNLGLRPRGGKAGVSALAKPADEVKADIPKGVAVKDLLPSALKKAGGIVERVQMTDALMETVKQLTAEGKTVRQIAAVTGLGMSTIFRYRKAHGIKVGGNAKKPALVAAMAKPAKRKKQGGARKAPVTKRPASAPVGKKVKAVKRAKPAKRPATKKKK